MLCCSVVSFHPPRRLKIEMKKESDLSAKQKGLLKECDVTDIRNSHCQCSACYSLKVTERRNDIHFHFMTNIKSTADIKWNKICNLLCM